MTTGKRAILEGGLVYEVPADARVGDTVRGEYGDWGKQIEQRIVGFQTPEALETCHCGTRVVRLADGGLKPAYFGPCKRAYVVAAK